MVGEIIGLFILDYRMTLLGTSFIPVKAVIMKHFAKKRKESWTSLLQKAKNMPDGLEILLAVREVKLFGIQENKRAEFADRQLSVINKQKKMNTIAARSGTA